MHRTNSGLARRVTSVIRSSISSSPRPTRRRATRSSPKHCGSRYGAELIDRVGPSIIMTHSAGGPFGWLVANERPNLVKAVVSFEGATAPLVGPGGAAGTALPNLKNMPIMYLLAERGGRDGRPIIDALTQSGAKAELIDLKDRGILGNSHFAMFENNRRQVFEVIRGWIEQRVPANTNTSTAGCRISQLPTSNLQLPRNEFGNWELVVGSLT